MPSLYKILAFASRPLPVIVDKATPAIVCPPTVRADPTEAVTDE